MTIGELNAFIEGMDIKESPTTEQWAKLLEKIATVAVDPMRDLVTLPNTLGQPNTPWPFTVT